MPRTKNLGPVRAFANYDVIERMRICLPLKRRLQIRDFSAEKRPVPDFFLVNHLSITLNNFHWKRVTTLSSIAAITFSDIASYFRV